MAYGTPHERGTIPFGIGHYMDGEDPSTTSLVDAEYWQTIYEELSEFATQLASEPLPSSEFRQHLDAMKANLEARASFWKERCNVLGTRSVRGDG